MTLPDDPTSLHYDWNTPRQRRSAVEVADATLSDAPQSASVVDPGQRDKRRLLSLMSGLGVRAAALGHPGAGPRQFADTLDLARELGRGQWPIDSFCTARAAVKDIAHVLDVRERSGLDLEAAIAIGISPVRLAAEGVTLDLMHEVADRSLTFALCAGVRVIGVLEDASRTPPEQLATFVRHLLDLGVGAIRVCDTAGHLTPDGTRALLRFVIELVRRRSGRPVRIEWQGQNDRGLALANALAAVEGGVDRVLATAIGLGERSGTVAIEQLLVNLRLTGQWPHTLGGLIEYCDSAAVSFGVAIPFGAAVVGRDAFRTGTAARATALVKALRSGDRALADHVGSAVPASVVGAETQVDVTPMSGQSNVRWWLAQHGYDASDLLLTHELLLAVKLTQRAATDEELRTMADALLAARSIRV